MKYTYDDFLNAATKAGVKDRFSQKDLEVAQRNPEYGLSMVGLMQDISGATTAEQRLIATEAANQMRKNYGVYGVGDPQTGSSYAASYGTTIDDLMEQINGYGSFQYSGQDNYQKVLDGLVNQQPFSYDPETDPSWSAYKKAYMREGDRASANALAQASAASGGRASSYALTAAQQAGNYYAGQLADVLPSLEQQAYSRYQGDINTRMNALNALNSDRAFEQENWMNGYNMLQNSLGNYQNQDATDYQRYLDALNLQHQQEQAQQAQKQQEFQNAMALYQSTGHVTPELAAILGIPATGNGGNTGVTGTGGVIGDNSSEGSRGGYDNGTLKPEQIQELQRVLGVTDDGKYGTKSKAAAGGLSAEEAYEKYVQNPGGLYQEMLSSMVENVGVDEIDTSNYSVTNKTTADGIIIGGRRMTWTELIEAVNQGRVIETIDTKNGTITYTSSLKMDDSPAANGGGAGKKPFTMTQLGAN